MNQYCSKTRKKLRLFNWVLDIGLLAAIIVCSNAKAAPHQLNPSQDAVNLVDAGVGRYRTIGAGQQSYGNTLCLASIKPTVFFIKDKDALLQVVEVNIENETGPVEASLDVRLDGKQKITALGTVKKGKSTFQVHIPDIDGPRPVEFVLRAKGKV